MLVLQTGSTEIADMNIEKTLKETPKNIENQKQKWFEKV